MTPFTRRQLIAAGLGTAALGGLTACATPGTVSVNTAAAIPAASGPIRLQYWAWLKDLQKVCDVWNASNPNVQVDAVWIPGGNAGGYQKLYSALAAGGGPDIGQVEMRSLPEFMLVNGLVDLNRYGAEQYADRYDPTLWGQVSYTGGVYGIPQDSGPMAFFYQPEILDKVGAAAPATWDEWAAVATELRGVDSYIDCFPLADASVFAAFATQAGAQWLKAEDDGWVIDMTDDATTQVAQFFDTAIDQDLVQTGYGAYSPAWFAAAASGGIASCTTGSWGDALIQGVSGGSGKWKVAPMPTWGDTGFGSSFLGGSTAAVFASSKHPQEALEFAVWMTTSQEGIDAMIANSGIGWSPAVGEIGTTRQEPSEFFSGENYNEDVMVPASKEQNPDWSWWPVTQQSFNILSDGFRKKASGTSLVDAVAEAENQIITVFENKGLSIRKASA
ncbi:MULTISPECIES: ABC transporter substrate-binding protein [unclassified Rathayibacter]|uniref:ABC transporter substrate-binding protein n=1 Tax=unclassified Rathayibacter TaxID=2609250 RepID=UPI0006F2E68C|nr:MULTISPECIES: extracellular solute-binding protein [unclassified Rathayibacter]KQQ03716.1 ABC transporter substrate-binding protein [Rathayibacter sp. Leaf294]KQS12173.1 ABC transporter substrate-binding protein [Rathayibacter sp. Leaf185]